MVKEALVDPATLGVEAPRALVSGHDGKPRGVVPLLVDLSLAVGEKQARDPRTAVIFADVDLLDLVLDDHHEPCDLSGDLGDRRVGQSLLGPTPEGVLGREP